MNISCRLLLTVIFATVIPANARANGRVEWCPGIAKDNQALTAAAGVYLERASRAQAVVATEGTIKGNALHDSSVRAKSDWLGMRLLALAWASTGEDRYLKKVSEYFSSWLSVYSATFNPIDDTDLDAVIDAYAITKGSLPADVEAKAGAFIRQLGRGYAARMASNRGKNGIWKSNWQSHRVKLLTLAAVATDDNDLLDQAEEFYRDQVVRNISSNGSTYDFELRDAIHYATYSLEPLTRAAVAAKSRGRDWYGDNGPGGGRLNSGLVWLESFATGKRTHLEFANTKVEFDITRRNAGVEGFSGAWNPAGASALYWLASAGLNPAFKDTATQTGPEPLWISACWGDSTETPGSKEK